jgi:hypothetical protein
MLAKVVAASANRRAITAAVSGKRLGCRTVALAGQPMMTTAGVSSASTNSIASVSAALIWLEASTAQSGRCCWSDGWYAVKQGTFRLLIYEYGYYPVLPPAPAPRLRCSGPVWSPGAWAALGLEDVATRA